MNKNPKRKRGLTLIETVMAIAIIIIGMEGFTLLFTRVWKNNSYALEMGQSSMAVSQGINKISNYIRGVRQADNGAYPVKSAHDNDLVVYADYDKDGTTERLHFYKNSENIIMGVTDPTTSMPKTYPTGDQQTITVVSHIVNDSSDPIFQYYGTNFAGDEAVDPPMSTPATVSNIRLMKIHLKMNVVPNRAPDNIELQSFVEMRNLNDYDRIK